MHVWHLGDDRQSMVIASFEKRLPEVVYWGPALAGSPDAETIAAASRMDVTGGMLDENPPLSLCPQMRDTFPGQPGLAVRDMEGTCLTPSFRLCEEAADESRLNLVFADTSLDLKLAFEVSLEPGTSVFVLQTTLESKTEIVVDWLAAPVLPIPAHTDELIEISGRWCSEFQTRRLPFAPGARIRDNRTGRTDHAHFPGVIACATSTTNTIGEAFSFHYGWSGGHRMIAEELPDGRRQIQFGHASASLAPGKRFQTAPLFAVHSTSGLNGAAVPFQRFARERIVQGARSPRPVHYNCWEAVYFDHHLDELKSIASRAAELGAERFVLDDGWFGKRDDDTSSLGDWAIDHRKHPGGLGPLIEHVTSLGMEFGLWFEPEMVNEDSDLFRAHPDWALGPADQIRGRQQLVLDMSKLEVRSYLRSCISEILRTNDIGYIKWDHNRVLPVSDAAQTGGVYTLLDELRAEFPKVEIESCASGGGRIDFGILRKTHRVWLSDSNDALERQRIQHDAALFLPGSVTGSHVGPRHCHTSGRVLDISLRAWTAAQRHMGFEMDPRELTEDEAATLRKVTSWWQANRDWMMQADILRLDSSDPAVIAEQQLAADGSRFAVFAAAMRSSSQVLPRPLRLTGLSPDTQYEIRLTNRDEAPGLSRGAPFLKTRDLVTSGQYLMSHGLVLPWNFPETIWVLEGRRV